MPNGILTNVGAPYPLRYWLQQTISGVIDWQMMIWVNDLVPDDDTVYSDLTEATWNGYNRVTLTRSLWTSPVVTDGCAVSTWGTDPYQWYVLGDPLDTPYGWAMIDPIATEIRWVQRFDDADIAPVELGGKFLLLPRITMTSAPCPGDSMMSLRKAAIKKGKVKRA